MLVVLAFVALPLTAQRDDTTIVVRADAKTGRLIRTVLRATPRVATGPELTAMVDRISAEHGVESQLVHSVIRAESNYNANAVSPKGASGIMQLVPATARRFGVTNAFDPGENIEGGVRYLRFLLDYYQDDYPKAIAAYNAGESAVDRYKGIPPFSETRNYVLQVARNLKAARAAMAPRTVAQAAAATDNNRETRRAIETSRASDGLVYYRTP